MLDLRLPRLLGHAALRCGLPLFVAVVALLLPLVAHAGTITVDGTTCTLPEAITAANTDAVAGGCAAGSGDDTLLLGGLTHSLTTGPYDYYGLTATPSVTSKIVISGGMGGAIVERSGETKYRLFYVGETGDLALNHVIVRNGDIAGTYAGGLGGAIYNEGNLTLRSSQITLSNASYGGGIYNTGGKATLIHSMVALNTAGSGGGGIWSGRGFTDWNGNSSVVSIDHTLVTTNMAGSNGGGIANRMGIVTITDSDFVSNTAGGSYDDFCDCYSIGVGGAIFNVGEGAFLAMIDSNITLNAANGNGRGGGIYNIDDSAVSLTGVLFGNNIAGIEGGALANEDSTFSLENSTVVSNISGSRGGGIHNSFRGTGIISNSQIISNVASDEGGGIYNSSTLTVTNNDIIANSADRGGGIHTYGGMISLTSSDIISNTAAYGGGFYSIGDASAAITITNATIRANVAITGGGAIYKGSGFSGDSGSATIIGSRLINNHAGFTGSTIQQLDGTTAIEQSCIVNNSDTAINFGDGDPIGAANNWWGAPDGPSGAGSGGGDSVSFGVNFEPFLTTPVAGCPWLTAMVTASTPEATVGETITFTYHITNSSSLTLTTISAVDDQFGPVEALEGPLLPAASRSVTLTHVLEPDDLPGPLTSAVTVTGTDTFGIVVTARDSISVTILPAVLQPGEIFLPNVQR